MVLQTVFPGPCFQTRKSTVWLSNDEQLGPSPLQEHISPVVGLGLQKDLAVSSDSSSNSSEDTEEAVHAFFDVSDGYNLQCFMHVLHSIKEVIMLCHLAAFITQQVKALGAL